MDLNNHLWSLAFSPKTFLYIFCKAGLLTTDSLGVFFGLFFNLRTSLPSFLRDSFPGYKILGWHFFLFFLSGLWTRHPSLCPLVSTVSNEKSVNLTEILGTTWGIFLLLLSRVSLCPSTCFTMMCLSVDFFVFVLLRVYDVSWMWRLFFIKLGSFQHYFF